MSQILFLERADSLRLRRKTHTCLDDVLNWGNASLNYFLSMAGIMKQMSSEHDQEVANFFAWVTPYIVKAAAEPHSLESPFKILMGMKGRVQIDDLPLLLGMGLDVLPFVRTRLEKRTGLLDILYCAQYLSSGGVSPHMLALILRHTKASTIDSDIAPTFRIVYPCESMTKASHFGTVFADRLKDIDFVSRRERHSFSRFVDNLLDGMTGEWKEAIKQDMAGTRLTWTVKGANTYDSPVNNRRNNDQQRGTIDGQPCPRRKRQRRDEDFQPPRQPRPPPQRPWRERRPSLARSASASSISAHGPPSKVNPYVNIVNQRACYPYRAHG